MLHISIITLILGGIQYLLLNRYLAGGYDLYGLSMNSFFFLGCNFTAGILFSQVRMGQRPRLQLHLNRFHRLTYWGLLGIIICLVALEMDKGEVNFAMYSFSLVQFAIALIIFPLAVGLFLYGLCSERTVISQFLGSKIMMELGKASYIFYLLHVGFLAVGIENVLHQNFIMEPIVLMSLVFIAIQMISLFGFYFFEKPMARFIYRLLSAKSPNLAA